MDDAHLARIAGYTLYFMVAVIGLGSIGIATLTVDPPRRFYYSALIGTVSALMAASQVRAVRSAWSAAGLDAVLFVGGAVGGIAVSVLIKAALTAWKKDKYREFADEIKSDLEPTWWVPEAERESAPISSPDAIMRRWFVAIAAATGGIVGALFHFKFFAEALKEALLPGNLLSILLLTVVSIVLVGPVHESIIAHQLGEAHEERPHQRSIQLDSWRAALRLALVGSLLVVVELAYDCLDKSIARSDVKDTISMLVGALTPGIVSYYWSAALQIDGTEKRLVDQAGASATLCGSILYYGWGVALVALGSINAADNLFNSIPAHVPGSISQHVPIDARGPFLGLLFSPILGAILAFVLAFITIGLPTIAGGFVLARMSGWPAMGALFAALCACFSLTVLATELVLWIVGVRPDWSLMTTPFLNVAGWMFGLIASGFPKLVTHAGKLRGASGASATAPSGGA